MISNILTLSTQHNFTCNIESKIFRIAIIPVLWLIEVQSSNYLLCSFRGDLIPRSRRIRQHNVNVLIYWNREMTSLPIHCVWSYNRTHNVLLQLFLAMFETPLKVIECTIQRRKTFVLTYNTHFWHIIWVCLLNYNTFFCEGDVAYGKI